MNVMRRFLLLAVALLLFGASCTHPYWRNRFPDGPVVGRPFPIAGPGGAPVPPPAPPPTAPVCRELSRIPCDVLHCPGPGYDFVLTQCAGEASTGGKCIPTGKCVADSDDTK